MLLMKRQQRIFAKIATIGMLGGVISTNTAPLIANAQKNPQFSHNRLEKSITDSQSDFKSAYINEKLSQEDKDFMKKLSTIYSMLELNKNNHLILNVSDSELKEDYDFSVQEIEKVHATIAFQIQNTATQITDTTQVNDGIVSPMLHVSDWKVYFTNYDVRMYFSSAIQAGAPAVVATLAALGSTVATPGVGTVLGVVVGLFSAGAITYQVTQAMVNDQGFYIGVD